MINEAAILQKAKAAMERADKKALVNEKVDSYMLGAGQINGQARIKPTTYTANSFADTLRARVGACQSLGGTAISALSNISSPGADISQSGKEYKVYIKFDGDLTRPSLYPEKYGGISNIAALLNNGYTAGGAVFGMWHGKRTWSLTQRDGARFVNDAISDFRAKFAEECGVKDISAGDYEN